MLRVMVRYSNHEVQTRRELSRRIQIQGFVGSSPRPELGTKAAERCARCRRTKATLTSTLESFRLERVKTQVR